MANNLGKSLAVVLGAGLAVGAVQVQAAPCNDNPFGATAFEQGSNVVVADNHGEGKDGEHKCGSEGKCGSSN